MAAFLFSYRNVPDDEIDAVLKLLQDNGIDFYETPPGNWGISAGGIWLRDAARLEAARELLTAYQQQRRAEAREAYEVMRREGSLPTLFDRVRAEPLRFLLYLAAILLILYLSTMPFIDFGR